MSWMSGRVVLRYIGCQPAASARIYSPQPMFVGIVLQKPVLGTCYSPRVSLRASQVPRTHIETFGHESNRTFQPSTLPGVLKVALRYFSNERGFSQISGFICVGANQLVCSNPNVVLTQQTCGQSVPALNEGCRKQRECLHFIFPAQICYMF